MFKISRKLTILFIIALVLAGSLGLSRTDNAHAEGSGYCPLSLLSGEVCPDEFNSLALVNHHLSGVREIGKIVATANFSVILTIFFLIVVLAAAESPPLFPHQQYKTRYRPLFEFINRAQKYLFWLGLHNKQSIAPAFIQGARKYHSPF